MNTLSPQKLKPAVAYIDKWLDFNFQDSRLPALSVAIQHGSKLIYSRAFGLADVAKKVPATSKTAFRIASHSKTFTATAIMQLVEAEKLRLDDKVSQHLEWFKSSKDKRVAEVTVRQLLNHTSGVIRDGDDSDFWQVLRPFPDEAELKKYITTSELVYDADEKFKYSNFGFSYLGMVIEAVSGQSYRDYVSEQIVNKLGLKSTGPDLDAKAKKILATGYGIDLFNQDRRIFEQIDTRAMSAATGFYATAEDVCKYFSAHFFGNDNLVSDGSKRAMQHGYWRSEGTSDGYGLGMVDYRKKGWHIFGHSGGFPGFITNTLFDANRQIVVSVLTNAYDSPTKKISNGILDIIDTFQQDTAPGRNSFKKFEGRFYCTWGATDFVAVGSKLYALEPAYWNVFENGEELSVADSKTLKIEKTNGFGSQGELIKYSFSSNGSITGVSYAGRTMLTLAKAQNKGWFKK